MGKKFERSFVSYYLQAVGGETLTEGGATDNNDSNLARRYLPHQVRGQLCNILD